MIYVPVSISILYQNRSLNTKLSIINFIDKLIEFDILCKLFATCFDMKYYRFPDLNIMVSIY